MRRKAVPPALSIARVGLLPRRRRCSQGESTSGPNPARRRCRVDGNSCLIAMMEANSGRHANPHAALLASQQWHPVLESTATANPGVGTARIRPTRAVQPQ